MRQERTFSFPTYRASQVALIIGRYRYFVNFFVDKSRQNASQEDYCARLSEIAGNSGRESKIPPVCLSGG